MPVGPAVAWLKRVVVAPAVTITGMSTDTQAPAGRFAEPSRSPPAVPVKPALGVNTPPLPPPWVMAGAPARVMKSGSVSRTSTVTG